MPLESHDASRDIRRLRVADVIGDGVRAVRRCWWPVLPAITVPATLYVVLGAVARSSSDPMSWENWLHIPVSLLSIVIDVICLRIVLLGDEPTTLGFHWTSRDTRVLRCFVKISVCLVPLVLVGVAAFGGFEKAELEVSSRSLLSWVFVLPFAYVYRRLTLAIPAIAIDGSPSLRHAWALSRGNGWRLCAGVDLAPWLLSALLPSDQYDLPIVIGLTKATATLLISLLQTVLLAVAFRRLGGMRAPGPGWVPQGELEGAPSPEAG